MDKQQQDMVTMVPTRLGALRVEASGTGRPAVLWHSLFVDSTSWSRVRDALGQSRRLYMIEGPSHGASAPATRRFTLDDCAGAALDILDHLEITEPVDWVGNAWGGHVGILFAAAHPGRCRTLVTIGTPIQALRASERRQIAALVALYRVVGPIGPLVKAVERGLLSSRTRATDPDAVDIVACALNRADRRGMHTAMRSVMLARPDLTPTLSDIVTPTLIITGDELPSFSPSDARSATAQLPDGTAAVIAGTRHLAPLEAARSVAELVIAHWRHGSGLGEAPSEPAREVGVGRSLVDA
ncbi:MAG: alpha/beta hydrolase [Candidatus Dormiibacterota bacterium]